MIGLIYSYGMGVFYEAKCYNFSKRADDCSNKFLFIEKLYLTFCKIFKKILFTKPIVKTIILRIRSNC